MEIDLNAEAERLREVMDKHDCVNIFLSEGAGVQSIIEEMEAAGEEVLATPSGHVKLDKVNPGQWFGKQFAKQIGAEKVLVQKSGYCSQRSIQLSRYCFDSKSAKHRRSVCPQRN